MIELDTNGDFNLLNRLVRVYPNTSGKQLFQDANLKIPTPVAAETFATHVFVLNENGYSVIRSKTLTMHSTINDKVLLGLLTR